MTGASGHLGYVVYRTLLKEPWSLNLLLRQPVDYLDDHNFFTVYGRLEARAALVRLVDDCDAVIHMAAKVWPTFLPNERVNKINYECARDLYQIAMEQGVKHFVFVSSIHSMITPDEDVLDEDTSLYTGRKKPYDKAKADMERFLKDQDEDTYTILNPTAVIGPGDRYLRGMNQMFQRIEQDKLPMVTAGGFNVVDVRDVALAIKQVVADKITGKFMLGSKYFEIKELAQLYGQLNGLKVTNKVLGKRMMRFVAANAAAVERLKKQPVALNRYAVETLLEAHQNISSQRAKDTFAWEVRPIEETLKDIHLWFGEEKFKL